MTPSDRWDLTENLALRFQPIIKRSPMPVAPLTVELMGPFCDQDMQVIAGRHRQRMLFLGLRSCGRLLGGR